MAEIVQSSVKESKIVTMCDDCHAVKVIPGFWVRYGVFGPLYERVTDGSVGIIYESCPVCSFKYWLRKSMEQI